jgi:phosphohistidine phosphatase
MLYLVQHGEATKETEDPARPLTEHGRQEVVRVAHALARLRLGVSVIAHSGKLRARQTAELLAAALQPTPSLVERAGLAPNDDPAEAARLVLQSSAPILLVGHLPHLSQFASLLLVGDPAREVIAFRPGGVVCLSQENGRWRLSWALTPNLVAE